MSVLDLETYFFLDDKQGLTNVLNSATANFSSAETIGKYYVID